MLTSCAALACGFQVHAARAATDVELHFAHIDGTGHEALKYAVTDEQKSPCVVEIASFSEGMARVYVKFRGGLFNCYVDKTGAFVIPPRFSHSRDFHQGLAAVATKTGAGGKETWGFIDKSGKFLIPQSFDNVVADFAEDRACVLGQQGYQVIDKTGKTFWCGPLLPCGYSEGLCAIKRGAGDESGLEHFIDREGKVVLRLPPETELPDVVSVGFVNGLAVVRQKIWDAQHTNFQYRYGYIDKTGKIAIALKYAAADKFSEGRAIVRSPSAPLTEAKIPLCDIIDPGGKSYGQVPAQETVSGNHAAFHDFLLRVTGPGRLTGYVDRFGKSVVPAKYATGTDFDDGKALVVNITAPSEEQPNFKCNVIDKRGQSVATVGIAKILNTFSEGLAPVMIATPKK